MAAAGLGDDRGLPVPRPARPPPGPRRRSTLLQELGALDARRRARRRSGRRLAQLPVDPRMGRMVLEADELGCADEVIVDRRRAVDPGPARAARRQAGAGRPAARALRRRDARTSSPTSTCGATCASSSASCRATSSASAARPSSCTTCACASGRTSPPSCAQRAPRASASRSTRARPSRDARPRRAAVRPALARRRQGRAGGASTSGARGARFAIFPGSALARKPPAWVMVAELVETSRLWGRDAARIDPTWIEPLAEHLVTPHLLRAALGSPRAASVVATERVTLYGLPIVAGRTVDLRRASTRCSSRELFIRRALVEGDWETRHAFFADNRRRVEEVEALEDRARRRDLLAGDEALLRLLRRADPGRRRVRRALRPLVARRAPRRPRPADLHARAAARPRRGRRRSTRRRARTAWKQGDLVLPLSYRFEPGAEHDGVTVHVPLTLLGAAAPGRLRLARARPSGAELVTALMRSLPKELRRRSCRCPRRPRRCSRALQPRSGPLLDALAARARGAARRARPARPRGTSRRLPAAPADDVPRSRTTTARVLAEGDDLDALREQAARRGCARSWRRARAGARAHGLTRVGPSGTLPREVALPGTGRRCARTRRSSTRATTVGVRGARDAGARRPPRWRAGTRRLLLLTRPVARCATCPAGSANARAARARRRAARQRRARSLEDAHDRGARRADRRGRRPGVGRGRLRAAARPRRGRAGRPHDRDRRRRSRRSSTPRATVEPPARAADRAPLAAGARATSRASSRRLVHPGFVDRGGRGPAARRRALPARRRAAARAPAGRPRPRPRPHARRPRARGAYRRARSTRWPAGARCPPGCARCRGCSRSCASATSRRASGRAGRCRRSGSAARSRRPRPRRGSRRGPRVGPGTAGGHPAPPARHGPRGAVTSAVRRPAPRGGAYRTAMRWRLRRSPRASPRRPR